MKEQYPQKILHVDMDAFFASVEQYDFPSIRGKPVVVGGHSDRRGVVAAASYEARNFGIRSAMSMGEALRLCPNVVRQPVRMARYKEVSMQVREIFHQFADVVEPLSVDEAFLDVSQSCVRRQTTATKLAYQLKQTILEQTGLTASAGVAPNKFLAKIASDMNKPNGLTVVQPHEVQDFLDPLPVRKIWGIGPRTAERLHREGIDKVWQLRLLELEDALKRFGRSGLNFYRLSRGIDPSPVSPRGKSKSISTENTFSQDTSDPLLLTEELFRQVEELVGRLSSSRLVCSTLILKLRHADFSTVTRSQTFAEPNRELDTLRSGALSLLERTEYKDKPSRLLGLGVTGLLGDDRPLQLRLFED